MTKAEVPDFPGAETVVSWFGSWPSFHDAEVLHVELNRVGSSRVSIHAWNMSGKTYEANGKTYFATEKHAVVTFEFEGLSALDLHEFNSQNVVSGVDAGREGEAFYLELHPCYGLSGRIEAARMAVSLAPGKPAAP